MNARPCVLCRSDREQHTAAPGWHTCHLCADWLAGQLGDLADQYATLTVADELIPTSSGERGSPGFGPRSPAVDALLVHSDVRTRWTSEMGYGALAVVESWARMIREETGAAVPAGRATMARELATIRFNWNFLLGSAWVDEFAKEIGAALHSLKHSGRLTERVMRIGPCPVVLGYGLDEQERLVVGQSGQLIPRPCGTMLTVRANADEIHCRTCDTIWPRSTWTQLGDPWTDYAALSGDLNVPVGTLRRWCAEDGWDTKRTAGRHLVARAEALASAQRRGRWTPAA